jgi:ATP-dependent Lhr-like helicase
MIDHAMTSYSFLPAVTRWFERTFGSPSDPQLLGWPAIQSGRHVLISAPTGSGKTLAAFLASLDMLFRQGCVRALPDETEVVYISPLKALSNDIRKNLQEPLDGIKATLREMEGKDVVVRAEVRTGDTPAAQRQALAKKPPHILVTTPESFYLLLTSDSGRRMLKTVRTVIVDEIHAVADDRRGSHLALSIERLAALTQKPLQRIGLSATQKPIEEVARFLVGTDAVDSSGIPNCEIVNVQHDRALDIAIELPSSALEAVMSHEVWAEVYNRLAELIKAHRTTLVFVNTRRFAERVTRHLGELIGEDSVTSHHGSLSAKLRLDAEDRLKRGELKALVATASLELGIDIGSVDLVCQIGSTRSISALLQRVGRAEHKRGGLPKGRIFPLTRDELVECAALLDAVRRHDLDCLEVPEKPLDVLAQQIVAAAGCEDLGEAELFTTIRRAWPYRNLAQEEFDAVIKMLAEGFSTKRGRRAALIHYDAINGRIRGRKGSRLLALTSGGAIPDNADYRVVVDPTDTFIGTVNEDFAVESLAGDIFQLGNASWRILRINSGTVRVEDAKGQPPGIPFWLGEAPSRTAELSKSVSEFRARIESTLATGGDPVRWLTESLPGPAAEQLAAYFGEVYRVLGCVPSQDTLVMERFFDESGGMQLVLHSPFGSRVNRAWGLALRKRFCRSFNFELQAAATEDAIVISLGTQHSFPLDEVFRYLNSKTVRPLLVQALLDAPMFTVRWRWNATRSLAVPRSRSGKKSPAPLQRMDAENLLAAVFPDQLACLEHIVGDREVPDHPLVNQTIEDCLTDAMDIDGLEAILRRIEDGSVRCVACDMPEPSPLAHEILNARPYAFLDNAPLEERRTQAVYTRRAHEPANADDLGSLDPSAVDRVTHDAWPEAANDDELHDALLLLGVMSDEEIVRTVQASNEVTAGGLLANLKRAQRIGRVVARTTNKNFWAAAERLPMLRDVYRINDEDIAITSASPKMWERAEAVRELVRGRIECSGPDSAAELAEMLALDLAEIDGALLALEAEGFVLRGQFRPNSTQLEWCDRRLLARIHSLTINRLRAEIEPVSQHDFYRFLFAWQHAGSAHQLAGPEGLAAVLELLDGYELPLAAWEPDVLSARVSDYDPHWLDRLSYSGRVGWGRFTSPQTASARPFSPLRSSPIALYQRENLDQWLKLVANGHGTELTHYAKAVVDALTQNGAQFFGEIIRRTRLLPVQVEQALGELAAVGLVTADGFDGLRALLIPSEKRPPLGRHRDRRRTTAPASVEFAGRWSLLRQNGSADEPDAEMRHTALEKLADTLLHRYGVMFRRLLERESLACTWYELGRIYRRKEARGEIRGGHFVSGVSGEQFALPEAIGMMRSIRKTPETGELTTLSAADPLNLQGILNPGPRVSALAGNRILFRDGLPIAALEAGKVKRLTNEEVEPLSVIEDLLKVGKIKPVLRLYYA